MKKIITLLVFILLGNFLSQAQTVSITPERGTATQSIQAVQTNTLTRIWEALDGNSNNQQSFDTLNAGIRKQILLLDSLENYGSKVYTYSVQVIINSLTSSPTTFTLGNCITNSSLTTTSGSINIGMSNYEIIGGYGKILNYGGASPVVLALYSSSVSINPQNVMFTASNAVGNNFVGWLNYYNGFGSGGSYAFYQCSGQTYGGTQGYFSSIYSNNSVLYWVLIAGANQSIYNGQTFTLYFTVKKRK